MTEEQYPQYIPFDFVQEKCVLLDNFQEGQTVRISFNIRGREWVNLKDNRKYIVNFKMAHRKCRNSTKLSSARATLPTRLWATRLPSTRLCTTTIPTGTSQYQQAALNTNSKCLLNTHLKHLNSNSQPTPQQAFGTPPVQNAPVAPAEPEDDLLPF